MLNLKQYLYRKGDTPLLKREVYGDRRNVPVRGGEI